MALTKARSTLQSSASNSAGGTTTGSWVDVSGSYAVDVIYLMTNGATGPTIACEMRVEAATDSGGTGALVVATVSGPYGNSAVARGSVPLPPGVQFIRSVFTGNTGQTVTVQAVAERVTGV